jgi:hypothetical protein
MCHVIARADTMCHAAARVVVVWVANLVSFFLASGHCNAAARNAWVWLTAVCVPCQHRADEPMTGDGAAAAAAEALPPPIARFRNYTPHTPDLARGVVERGRAPLDALVEELKSEDVAAFALRDVRACVPAVAAWWRGTARAGPWRRAVLTRGGGGGARALICRASR